MAAEGGIRAPRIVVEIHASKITTRDGSHQDDDWYIDMIKGNLERTMREYEFFNAKVEVRFEVPVSNDDQ